MGRKNRAKKRLETGGDEFSINPFAGLDVEVPEDPAPPSDASGSAPASDAAGEAAGRGVGGDDPVTAEMRRALGDQGKALDDGEVRRGTLTLRVERKGRRGKTVTVLAGFEGIDEAARMQLLASLRKALGTGGTFVEDHLEIQGDQRGRARALLQSYGFTVKGM